MRGARRRAGRFGALALGFALIASAAAAVAVPLWWTHRSEVTSTALLHRAGVIKTTGASRVSTASCVSAGPAVGSATEASGVLAIPSIGVLAPVLDGLGDNVLNVAVGHDPTTPWPGEVGLSMLEAHDVSFFSHLSALQPGDTVTWQAGCALSTFTVTGTTVMMPGQPVAPPADGTGIALVTCWPTDALWWTNKRYVVTASLVTTALAASPTAWPAPARSDLRVPAAPSLAAGGLGLTTNSVELGTLTLRGTPSAAWSSSPAPLDVARSALEEYVAARRSVSAHNLAWWESIATVGLPMPSAWTEPAPLNVSIEVGGSTVHTVTLQSGATTIELAVTKSNLQVAAVTTS